MLLNFAVRIKWRFDSVFYRKLNETILVSGNKFFVSFWMPEHFYRNRDPIPKMLPEVASINFSRILMVRCRDKVS